MMVYVYVLVDSQPLQWSSSVLSQSRFKRAAPIFYRSIIMKKRSSPNVEFFRF
jgi:hypothetical protein